MMQSMILIVFAHRYLIRYFVICNFVLALKLCKSNIVTLSEQCKDWVISVHDSRIMFLFMDYPINTHDSRIMLSVYGLPYQYINRACTRSSR
jgi:hypothetical protein